MYSENLSQRRVTPSANPPYVLNRTNFMFNRKTVFVLGAGASAEFGMPVGSRLMSQVADAVQFGTSGADLHFRQKMKECLDAERIVRLEAAGHRLLPLIPRFGSMDEVLHFLSDDPDALELGKIAIAYQILKAERNSFLFGMMLDNPQAIIQCDSTWAPHFLRIALSASRRREFESYFLNVTIIDFNYDRVFPKYMHSALQRLYGFSASEATVSLNGLTILHPYGSLGPLEWQGSENALAFADEKANLMAIARRIRTYTEERSDPVIGKIANAIDLAEVVVVLGFGFHNQNIDILSANRGTLNIPVFMTVQGIGTYNHEPVTAKIRSAIRTNDFPQFLSEEAKSFMHQFGISLSLAVS